ncbi:MocR-like pyridoxine biosynthesis transcription factor PdxR [Thalassotalea fusca]
MTRVPAYKQVYQRIHTAILQGILKPGEKIPSARVLSKEMGVARGTVEEGYAILKAEGYIESKGQAGTVVCKHLLPPSPNKKTKISVLQPGFSPDIEAPNVLPFQLGIPALDNFPKQVWSRIVAKCARNLSREDLAYPSVYGLPSLRRTIAQYLQLSRGVKCDPSQVFITSGYVNSINWISNALLKADARIAIEDPGYPLTRRVLQQKFSNIIPIPVDDEGINLATEVDADAVIVTPTHQSPTCVALSLPRRQKLLNWANKKSAWIIEDDYDGEYRHAGLPLPALKSLDVDDRVIYSGTFSKVLFPSLRMAYIVVPVQQVKQFEESAELFGGNISSLNQAAVSAFIEGGQLSRHIQRMRKLYRERRELTASVFKQVLGEKVLINNQPGGMNMIVQLKDVSVGDAELSRQLLAAGIFAHGLSQWSAKPVPFGLILSFTNIQSQDECEKLVHRIKDIAYPD